MAEAEFADALTYGLRCIGNQPSRLEDSRYITSSDTLLMSAVRDPGYFTEFFTE